MKILYSSVIYENPLPQLNSRQAFFPYLAKCDGDTVAAVFVIGQAFESVDSTCYIAFSHDGGKTWGAPQPMFDKSDLDVAVTDYAKAIRLADGRLVALGYAYLRTDEVRPIGNPENGGTLDDFVFLSVSEDGGKTWSKMQTIDCAWGPHVEASAPITVLQDGSWISPITGFPDWDGVMTGKLCGRALRSYDAGKTWNDDVICMDFNAPITCYEQRMCQLDSGTIVCIGWNENVETGERLENHYTLSFDNGKTFTEPRSTGILGQASSVCALGGEKLLAIHAIRRDTDKPGIYGCIVDLSEGKWNIIEKQLLWAPATPVIKDTKMAEIFSFLKFGQPAAIRWNENEVLMSHWYADQGQYRTVCTRIHL